MLHLLLVYCIMNTTGTGLNTTYQNVTGIQQIFGIINNNPCLPGGIFGFALLGIIMFVAFGAMALRYDVSIALVVSGFLGTVISVFLVQLGYLSTNLVYMPIALVALGSVIFLLRNAMAPY